MIASARDHGHELGRVERGEWVRVCAAVATYVRAMAIEPLPVTPLKHHEVELGWKKEKASVRREEDGGCNGVWRCAMIKSSARKDKAQKEEALLCDAGDQPGLL